MACVRETAWSIGGALGFIVIVGTRKTIKAGRNLLTLFQLDRRLCGLASRLKQIMGPLGA